jgi:hypothetical protein
MIRSMKTLAMLFGIAGLAACGGGDGGGGGGGADGGGGGTVDTETGCRIFPADNPWNQAITEVPVHADSDAFIDSIGRTSRMHPDFGTMWQGEPIGIPFAVVPGTTMRYDVTFDYADESDPGPYPIPDPVPVEGGGDRHIIVIDDDACMLYEIFAAEKNGDSWSGGSGAIWDLDTNDLRPEGWTSADAAGLPIFPGLVRYSEVVTDGVIDHALRFTVSRSQRGYIWPARHAAGSTTDASAPPMGLRLRMKPGYDCSGFSGETQVICTALKTYGMFVADNGSNWYLSGAPDPRWDDDALNDVKQIPGDAFEVVDTGDVVPE